jgi:hypothetical protein
MWFWVVDVRFVRITSEGDSLVKRCFGLMHVCIYLLQKLQVIVVHIGGRRRRVFFFFFNVVVRSVTAFGISHVLSEMLLRPFMSLDNTLFIQILCYML